MPVPHTPTPPVDPPEGAPLKRGFHLPPRQPYAVTTARRSHTEVLYTYGELAMFVLMWNKEDFDYGRVGRCLRCQARTGSGSAEKDALIFETFAQPPEGTCPDCYGTTFEGGWKAKVIRPSIWNYSEEIWKQGKGGYVTSNDGSVQTTSDFYMADSDYIFRADGTRWMVAGGATDRINDGFGMNTRSESNLGYSYAKVVREDHSDPSYSIPPTTPTELREILERGRHFAPNFSSIDEIRGPILIEQDNHPVRETRITDGLPGPPISPR